MIIIAGPVRTAVGTSSCRYCGTTGTDGESNNDFLLPLPAPVFSTTNNMSSFVADDEAGGDDDEDEYVATALGGGGNFVTNPKASRRHNAANSTV